MNLESTELIVQDLTYNWRLFQNTLKPISGPFKLPTFKKPTSILNQPATVSKQDYTKLQETSTSDNIVKVNQ